VIVPVDAGAGVGDAVAVTDGAAEGTGVADGATVGTVVGAGVPGVVGVAFGGIVATVVGAVVGALCPSVGTGPGASVTDPSLQALRNDPAQIAVANAHRAIRGRRGSVVSGTNVLASKRQVAVSTTLRASIRANAAVGNREKPYLAELPSRRFG